MPCGTVTLDCRVTPYGGYAARYPHSIDGVPTIVEINPQFWNLDLSQVLDTYFHSTRHGRQWITGVWFIPDPSTTETDSLYIHSSANGWKHWTQVVPDYLGYVGHDHSDI